MATRGVFCWDALCNEVVAIGGDVASKQLVRELLLDPYNAGVLGAIDSLGDLGDLGGSDALVYVRRLRLRIELVVVIERDAPDLELARLRVGHAALAIERALAR